MLIIPTDKGISAELAMFNSHEPLTTGLLLSELRKGMVCLDIGSNIGYYALLESRIVGNEGRVICIEPSPLNFQYLKKNLETETRSRVETHNIAVGDVDGHTNFLTGIQSNLSRAVKENEEISLAHGQNKIIRVPIRRVDTLINEIGPEKLDFIRMDPEGYEANIYQGMKSTIRKYKPMLLIEFHRNYLGIDGTKHLLQELRDDGYDSVYYIPRWMDNPIIASQSYVQRISISKLLKKLDKDSLPAGFNLLLVNRG
jgi:FkbM family methyltransferase